MNKTLKAFMAIMLVMVLVASCNKDNDGISVVTCAPQDVYDNSVVCGGKVTVDEGKTVDEIGVCWSTNRNPTVSDDYLLSAGVSSPFFLTIGGLTLNTTYFVRAFARCDSVYHYGGNKSFTTTLNGLICWGNQTVLPGVFSIGENQHVKFAPGNLQYNAFEDVWRFAEHQWDCMGRSNANLSNDYGGWIDLFGWGTSGYDHGAVNYQPWSTSSADWNYKAYGVDTLDLFDKSGRADWGYNAICNGGDMVGVWLTLTQLEWDYLFNVRYTYSGARFAKAQVVGVKGVILLPDNWRTSYYHLSHLNDDFGSFTANTLSETQWARLEQYGAVFLPCAGYREYTTCYTDYGYYWSASHESDNKAYSVYFNNFDVLTDHADNRSKGFAVRLAYFLTYKDNR